MTDGLLIKGVRFAMAAPGADTDIFRITTPGSKDVGSGRLKPVLGGAFRVTISVASGSTLKLAVSDAATAGTVKTSIFNSGTALAAGQLYTFTHGVHPGLWYDYRLGTDVAVDYLQIDEANLGTT